MNSSYLVQPATEFDRFPLSKKDMYWKTIRAMTYMTDAQMISSFAHLCSRRDIGPMHADKHSVYFKVIQLIDLVNENNSFGLHEV